MGQVQRRNFLAGVVALLFESVRNSSVCAQPAKKLYRLGLLEVLPFPPLTDPFIEALRERGWVVGRDIHVERRATGRDPSRAAALARELVEQGVDVLVTVTTANALAARQASRSIPIVMLASGYPVESGLAESLARPGGNVTGLSIYAGGEIWGKYLGLLRELVPSLREVGIFWGYAPPAYSQAETDLGINEMRRAADVLKIKAQLWMTGTVAQFSDAMAGAENSGIEALLVTGGGVQGQPDIAARIVDFTARRRMPTISDVAGLWFNAGGLLAYSADFKELGVRAASFVDRILRGARAADLPIELPTRFELVINMKTARALGLTMPRSLLLRGDRVIE